MKKKLRYVLTLRKTFEGMSLDICTVTIDRVEEIDPRFVEPPYKYGFAYTISIHNRSFYTVQIQSRKWIVRDGDMKDRIVEGEGVVGQFPILSPGETFTYQSYHILRSRFGSALGFYYGVYTLNADPDGYYRPDNTFIMDGEPFEVEIPEFLLIHQEKSASS